MHCSNRGGNCAPEPLNGSELVEAAHPPPFSISGTPDQRSNISDPEEEVPMAISPLMPVYPRCDVAPVRGEGAYLYDAKGKQWLDFASGIAVNLLGHGHPHLTQAIQKQAATLMHVSNLYGSPQQMAVAERLVNLTFADTVFFTNSGAEAVECAVKTARAYHYATGNPQKYKLITFSNAFHGRTLATISATDQEKLRKGFEPLPDWFHVLPFNDLAAAEAAIDESTAGFLVEPIQGEGGVRPATPEFLRGLRALADKHGILLVLDEVQCGMARTGTLFAHEQYGITPDVMAVAKGIGGGFPVGACLATEKPPRAWSPARTAPPMAATRSRWRPVAPCSTSWPSPNSWTR
jgi:acetylornithine/N-succinyldiaminopimelate aminotransferase